MNTLLEQLMNNIQVGDDAKILAIREKLIKYTSKYSLSHVL